MIKPQGFGLLEVLLAIVLVGGVVLATKHYFPLAQQNSPVSQVAALIDTVVNTKDNAPQNAATSDTTLAQLGQLQQLMKSFLAKGSDSWQNRVEVQQDPTNAQTTIKLHGLSNIACNNLAEKLQGQPINIICNDETDGTVTFQGTF